MPDASDKRKRSLQFKSSRARLITKQPAAILRWLAARGSNFRHCILAAVYNRDALVSVQGALISVLSEICFITEYRWKSP